MGKNLNINPVITGYWLFFCIFRMTSRIGDYVSRTSIGAYFHNARQVIRILTNQISLKAKQTNGVSFLLVKISANRESRKLVLIIVAIALLLDNMLLTTVGKHKTYVVPRKQVKSIYFLFNLPT
jgi:hypothetical protein